MSPTESDLETLTLGSLHGRRAPQPLRLLSLAGGGYRGLFTAAVLHHLEQSIKPRRLGDLFDVVDGTSIGGLLACALASGRSAESILSAIRNSGPKELPRLRAVKARRIFGGPVYDAGALRGAIEDCLGEAARSARSVRSARACW